MIRKLRIWIFFCLLLTVSAALSQELPIVEPESVGLSSQRLERIAAAVQKSIDENRSAGAVTLVMRRGKVGWAKAQGMQDREAGKPMKLDTIFRIASMSKPITTVAAMTLYEEGRFLLNDLVSKYLPEFKNPKVLVAKNSNGNKEKEVPAKNEMTILDLLRHTSGLSYHWNSDVGPLYNEAQIAHGLDVSDVTLEQNIKNLAKLPLLFNPGEKFEYGLSADVLGRLIEVVSGKPLDVFLRTRIFGPLGMKDTYFYVPDDKTERVAALYNYFPEKGLVRQRGPVTDDGLTFYPDYPFSGPKKYFSGGAGLVSTAQDYALFSQMMLNMGKLGNTRILSRKTVEMMTRDQLGALSEEWAFGFGFGLEGTKGPLAGLATPGSYEWGGYFYTSFFVDPKEQMVFVFMSQLRPAEGLTLKKVVHELVYASIED